MTRPSVRTILHVDLDAFFAAVEQRDRPDLRGRPVVVGIGERGVVSAASYEARAFGIHSAMPIRQARLLCPDAVFLPVDGRRYSSVSRQVMAILRRFTPQVEPISIDEAFLDVSASRALFGDGPTIARRIKDSVSAELQLTASVGVATTKLVAKIASDLQKPDGLVVVPPGDEATFLAPLPISRLWGVGPKSAAALRDFGVSTIGDLAALPEDALVRRFGKHGASLHARARGLDSDPVTDPEAAKSIGHEHTLDHDTSDPEAIESILLAMADGVSGRLRSAGVRGSTVSVKIRDASFTTITRQRTLDAPTDMTEPIWRTAVELARPEVAGKRIRLLGVTMSGLGAAEQMGLFEGPEERRRRAVLAADAIRRRYGDRAVTRARLLRSAIPAPFERDPMTPLERRIGAGHERDEPGAPSDAPGSRDSQPDTEGREDVSDDG
ncbi:MAG TPA: DNA polymerase IV [Candidatus Limnocylindrales bacterium]|nr:DNA polymerase IV [Candidatus Limnocylindrales bacterium]